MFNEFIKRTTGFFKLQSESVAAGTRIVSVFLLLISLFLSQQIISTSLSNQQVKRDYVEVNHIKYGIFSVNEWKNRLAPIITEEVSEFNFSKANKRQLKAFIEAQLNVLIDTVYQKVKEGNKGSVKGWVKQRFINAFVDVDDLKKGIPDYADAIIEEMTKLKTKRHVKALLKDRLEHYFAKTFETRDFSSLKAILLRTGSPDIEIARIKIEKEIEENTAFVFSRTWLIILLAALTFLNLGLRKAPLKFFEYSILLLTVLILLTAGVTTPMIDMEAKIAKLSFVVMDHPVAFINQVLYFQSKSILDVFWVMVTHAKLQMKFVGILVISFSIVFPLIKMLASTLYFYNFRNSREKKWIHFFAFKSGKWSMTDVMVVAIFMSYTGFNGIITSQMNKLNSLNDEMFVLSTNGTSLQPGFYLFLSYTLLAMILSVLLNRTSPDIQTNTKK